jgi:hypothetical protein
VTQCQEPTYAVQQKAFLLDKLIGAQQQHFWDRKAERLGGREVYDEIKLGRLLDWDVARLGTAQNLVDIVGGAPELVREVWSIGGGREQMQ